MRVGVDTGGTFTDAVADDGRVLKVPSTPADPAAAVTSSLAQLGGGASRLAHGTTVATNALLQYEGGSVALVATSATSDVIEIARQTRPSLYDQSADRPAAPVPRHLRLEVQGRIAADGSELIPLGTVPAVPAGVQSVAVCLLHADLNPEHERQVAAVLAARGHDVVCSHQVSPEFREYERMITTVVDALLRPLCRGYLSRLAGLAHEVAVLTSAGGLVPLAAAAERPVRLLLSGPAGGVRAGARAAVLAGYPGAVTFDMGGTSTDVCLVSDGVPEPAGLRTLAGLPIRVPSLDVHTIGAGGGSIARIDSGGALVVGPQSAGAEPGPACYGRGGDRPTVTDADLVAGRIPADAAFPGLGGLDRSAAERALTRAGLDALGVIEVVDESMVRAIRVVTVERGVDPRHLALVAFGGAGPLHACALADALEMPAIVVPARAGVLSAVGLLSAELQSDRVRSWPPGRGTDGLARALADLGAAAAAELGEGAATVETAVDCRYAGQGHELTVSDVADFEAEHRRRNGFSIPGGSMEVVALRATARGGASTLLLPDPVPARAGTVAGPAVVAEPDCTIWVAPGWTARPGGGGAWVMERTP